MVGMFFTYCSFCSVFFSILFRPSIFHTRIFSEKHVWKISDEKPKNKKIKTPTNECLMRFSFISQNWFLFCYYFELRKHSTNVVLNPSVRLRVQNVHHSLDYGQRIRVIRRTEHFTDKFKSKLKRTECLETCFNATTPTEVYFPLFFVPLLFLPISYIFRILWVAVCCLTLPFIHHTCISFIYIYIHIFQWMTLLWHCELGSQSDHIQTIVAYSCTYVIELSFFLPLSHIFKS